MLPCSQLDMGIQGPAEKLSMEVCTHEFAGATGVAAAAMLVEHGHHLYLFQPVPSSQEGRVLHPMNSTDPWPYAAP